LRTAHGKEEQNDKVESFYASESERKHVFFPIPNGGVYFRTTKSRSVWKAGQSISGLKNSYQFSTGKHTVESAKDEFDVVVIHSLPFKVHERWLFDP
jgi:hypothetical protein